MSSTLMSYHSPNLHLCNIHRVPYVIQKFTSFFLNEISLFFLQFKNMNSKRITQNFSYYINLNTYLLYDNRTNYNNQNSDNRCFHRALSLCKSNKYISTFLPSKRLLT